MAPRKRTTKQRKNNPKTAKLEAFLEDFDSEGVSQFESEVPTLFFALLTILAQSFLFTAVQLAYHTVTQWYALKTRVGQLKEKLNQLLKDVDNSYNMALIKLPKAVRQTTWLEHYKSEKPKSPEVDNAKREEEAAIVESVVAEDHTVLLKSVKKTSKKKGGSKSSSEDENTPSTTKKGKTTRKPPTTSKRAKALSVSKQNSTIRRSTRKPLVTPARSLLDSSLMMGATPLVTPRFDPRLPKTPAVRVPRHKERVYSISVNGSPIAAGNDDIVINVPIGNGESIQLLASQMDSVDLSLLDETALKSIRLLQNRLTTLCETAE